MPGPPTPPPITVWQPKPTRRIDWQLYQACDSCGTSQAQPCRDLRISSRNTTGQLEAKLPHKGRQRVYTPTPDLGRVDAIRALLLTATLAATHGVDLDTRDALHALGVTDVEIAAAERATTV